MEPTLRERIIILLKTYPKLRDSPDKLVYSIWMNEIKDVHKKLNVIDFMRGVYMDEIPLTNSETINRTRREVQKEFKELAGNRKSRLEKAERVRQSISKIPYIHIS